MHTDVKVRLDFSLNLKKQKLGNKVLKLQSTFPKDRKQYNSQKMANSPRRSQRSRPPNACEPAVWGNCLELTSSCSKWAGIWAL